MSVLTHIPFGFRVSDQQLVDVSEVERGKKCGCICPSCKTELIARQGNVNEWCFAHVSKGGANSVKEECEYSFWVSIILMAKQIILSAKSIKVPQLTLYTNQSEQISITPEKCLSFDSVELEQRIQSLNFDAVINFKNYSIGVIFSTPNRKTFVSDFNTFESNTIGILEIDLFKIESLLLQKNISGKYTEILKDYILESTTNKVWLYHPRTSLIEEKTGTQLFNQPPHIETLEPPKVQVPQKRQTSHKTKIPIVKKGRTIYKTVYMAKDEPKAKQSAYEDNYKCLKCRSEWFGTHVCKKCDTHFYSTIKNKF